MWGVCGGGVPGRLLTMDFQYLLNISLLHYCTAAGSRKGGVVWGFLGLSGAILDWLGLLEMLEVALDSLGLSRVV